MHFAYHWRNWKNCIIFANFLPTKRGCSIEIKGVFVRDNELDLHNVHESPKIEHLPFSDMRKGEGQMKVKNLRKRKQNVQMNLLNLEQRDWQSNLSIQEKKCKWISRMYRRETVQPTSISERKKLKMNQQTILDKRDWQPSISIRIRKMHIAQRLLMKTENFICSCFNQFW